MSEIPRTAGRILLVDDVAEQLDELTEEVRAAIGDGDTEVVPWKPEAGEDVLAKFEGLVAGALTLVVTDYDLTKGPAGFFGASVVSWCQQKAIPVGDYSRGNARNLPKEPSLFEFRFPTTPRQAARRIVQVHRGFAELRRHFDDEPNLLSEPSPANMLALILGHEEAIPQFSLYTPQILANPGLVELFGERKSIDERRSLGAYLLGHLLFNSILRYPGPVLDVPTLCSYLAVADTEAEKVASLFEEASYRGPFHDMEPRFWRDGIDDAIDGFAEAAGTRFEGDMAAFRRSAVEQRLAVTLNRHGCPRCDGERGGFRCPFTHATVCELGECSVGASAWLPQGADLVRVERDYFNETSPMLGR